MLVKNYSADVAKNIITKMALYEHVMDPASRLKELNNKANDFTFDNKIPVKRYIRSSKEMERMVWICFLVSLMLFFWVTKIKSKISLLVFVS